MTQMLAVDVAIVGAGPAGAALAGVLAQLWSVAIIDRDVEPRPRVGESLIPAARPVLRDLGLLDAVEAQNFSPYLGNTSWWNAEPQHTDFLTDPRGMGWHLDRVRFEEVLRAQARDRGAHCLFGVTCRVNNTAATPVLVCTRADGNQVEVTARLLVDASGRRATLARALGAQRHRVDDQVARWTSWTSPAEHVGVATGVRWSCVASVPDGWWYSVQIPDESGAVTTVLAKHHDGGRDNRLSAGQLHEQARRVPGFGAGLGDGSQIVHSTARTVAANSVRLDRAVGDDWIAIGDAALGFDPIASRGIFNALYTALSAGAVIDASLQSGQSCLDDYQQDLDQVWASYLQHRSWIYESEQQWSSEPYWRSRADASCRA